MDAAGLFINEGVKTMHPVQVKGILSANNGMNLYRGCTHGCIYCDSRSSCYNMQHNFEDVEVKENAPVLLERALRGKKKRCMIGTGAMSDPYNHHETDLGLTRRCLEIIDHYEYGIAIQTKSSRILRDMDLLQSIHKKAKAVVQMTLTTYDEELCRIVEPAVSTTKERFETLMQFQEAGIPTVVWISPLLPFLNDTKENLEGLLDYCIQAKVKGIINFGMGLTLREGDREYYYAALDRHFPGLKERYIHTYGNACNLPSLRERELMEIFHAACRKHGIMDTPEQCFAYMRELPEKYVQQSLFDGNWNAP